VLVRAITAVVLGLLTAAVGSHLMRFASAWISGRVIIFRNQPGTPRTFGWGESEADAQSQLLIGFSRSIVGITVGAEVARRLGFTNTWGFVALFALLRSAFDLRRLYRYRRLFPIAAARSMTSSQLDAATTERALTQAHELGRASETRMRMCFVGDMVGALCGGCLVLWLQR